MRWGEVPGTNLCTTFHPPSWVRERAAAARLRRGRRSCPRARRAIPTRMLFLLTARCVTQSRAARASRDRVLRRGARRSGSCALAPGQRRRSSIVRGSRRGARSARSRSRFVARASDAAARAPWAKWLIVPILISAFFLDRLSERHQLALLATRVRLRRRRFSCTVVVRAVRARRASASRGRAARASPRRGASAASP